MVWAINTQETVVQTHYVYQTKSILIHFCMITILAFVPPNDAVGSYDEQYFAIQNFCNIKIDNGFGHFKDHFIRKLHGNTLTHSLQLLPFIL